MKFVITIFLLLTFIYSKSQTKGLVKKINDFYFFLDSKPITEYDVIGEIEMPYFANEKEALNANISYDSLKSYLSKQAKNQYPDSKIDGVVLRNAGVNFKVKASGSSYNGNMITTVTTEYNTECPNALLIKFKSDNGIVLSTPTSYNQIPIFIDSDPLVKFETIKKLDIKSKVVGGYHYNSAIQYILKKAKKEKIYFDAILINNFSFPVYNSIFSIQLIKYETQD